MKIVHLVGYFIPELGYQEYYLAKEHRKDGHDVYVITSDLLYPYKNIEEMLKQAGVKETTRKRSIGLMEIDGIKVYRLPHLFEYNDFIVIKGIKKLLKKIQPDVVFAHESRQGPPASAAFYKNKLGYKLLIDQHDFYHIIPNHNVIKKILRYLDYHIFRKPVVSYSLKNADKVVAVTDQTKEFLINTHKITKPIEVIPLGVDTDMYHYQENWRNEIRNKYKIKKTCTVLMFAGTIYRRKGLELLLNAFAEINNKDLVLFIVGTGDQQYINELKKLSIKNNIIFTGFVNKNILPKYFSAADIGVWPGNNSVIIMEAMACKLPIIMVNLQLSHLAKFNNGFIFEQDDIKALTKYITKLSNDKKLRDKMSNNSYKAVIDNYSYKTIARKFLKLAKY